MLNLDPAKLVVIAVLAILLLGPDRLPKVARQCGDAWRAVGEFRARMEAEVRTAAPDLPSTSELARMVRSPAALLDHLATAPDHGIDDAEPGIAVPEGLPGAGLGANLAPTNRPIPASEALRDNGGNLSRPMTATDPSLN